MLCVAYPAALELPPLWPNKCCIKNVTSKFYHNFSAGCCIYLYKKIEVYHIVVSKEKVLTATASFFCKAFYTGPSFIVSIRFPLLSFVEYFCLLLKKIFSSPK